MARTSKRLQDCSSIERRQRQYRSWRVWQEFGGEAWGCPGILTSPTSARFKGQYVRPIMRKDGICCRRSARTGESLIPGFRCTPLQRKQRQLAHELEPVTWWITFLEKPGRFALTTPTVPQPILHHPMVLFRPPFETVHASDFFTMTLDELHCIVHGLANGNN